MMGRVSPKNASPFQRVPMIATAMALWIAGTVEGQMSPKESLERGAAAARKAVALDDSLAQAHVTMCAATFFKDWNLEGALRECDRAIELDPEMAEAHHLRAKILATLNRHPKAIEARHGG